MLQIYKESLPAGRLVTIQPARINYPVPWRKALASFAVSIGSIFPRSLGSSRQSLTSSVSRQE